MKLPAEFISKNPRFNKKEQALIIGTLINKISLTCKRSGVVEIKLRKFGTIHTHRNRKRMGKLKYLRRWNKKSWAEKQRVDDYSIQKLLF